MAIGRLSVKVGKAGKAGPHAAYISREGQYAQCLERGEKLEATEAGNMPAWATGQPQQFWQAADTFERANGTTYREMEIALPRELEPEQRADLIREFVRQEIGERHAYQWAIHTPRAADGGDQPHVHLMFSERQIDGIERDPDQYFKRYNAKAPEKGGARKGFGPGDGQTLTKTERADNLKELRGRWELMCNEHLERAGHSQRIDMRSYAERGLPIAPEIKQLPSEWRGEGKARVIELREARQDARQAQRELSREVPDIKTEIKSQDDERLWLEAEIEKKQWQQDYVQRISAAELGRYIERLKPAAVIDLVERDEAVRKAHSEHQDLKRRQSEAGRAAVSARDQAQAWREAHKVQSWFHKKEFGHSPKLKEMEEQHELHRAEWQRLGPLVDKAGWNVQTVSDQVSERIRREQAPTLAKVAELEKLRQDKVRQELEQQKQERADREARQEKQAVVEAFCSMAADRTDKVSGWDDTGSKWQATPKKLQTLIDRYNSETDEWREKIRLALTEDPETQQKVRALLEEQQANYRENDYGPSI